MKTEDLVSLLATRLEPVDAARGPRRFVLAWVMGMVISSVFMAGTLRFNSALASEVLIGMFWIRAGFCASVALIAFIAVRRLGRPGVRLGLVPLGVALPVLTMWVLATIALINAAPQDRVPLILGHTAFVCPWLIALLAAPLFIALIWALRGFAPTQLRLAGAAVGLAGGAGGALVYTLHCPELAAPFIGIWYLLGMFIPAAAGASLGPRLLRW